MLTPMVANNPPKRPGGPLLPADNIDRPDDRWCDDGAPGAIYEAEPMITALCYPLYLIANDQGVLVANAGGRDCVLLFHRLEIAERHIAEAKVIGPLYPLAIPDAEAFRQGLESLPASVTCAIWDATVVPRAFVYMDMVDLFMVLDDA